MTSDDQVNAALEREAEFDRLELEVGASTAPYLRATTAERDRRVLAAEVRRLRGELQDERLSLAPLREAHAEALNAAAQNEAALAALRERHAAAVAVATEAIAACRCDTLHHKKSERHSAFEWCPVMARLDAWLASEARNGLA